MVAHTDIRVYSEASQRSRGWTVSDTMAHNGNSSTALPEECGVGDDHSKGIRLTSEYLIGIWQ